jgi:hypothetical protein
MKDFTVKILVITSCTSAKKYSPTNLLGIEDFDSSDRLACRTEELKNYKTEASEMYTGIQHISLMEGLKKVWSKYGVSVVDLYIISAGYGLLSRNDIIVPYEVTFGGMTAKQILERSKMLDIHKQVESLIGHYDLVFFLLGREYIIALRLPFRVSDTVTQIFLMGQTYRTLIPNLPNTFFVPAGQDLAAQLQTTNIALKGVLFRSLCETVHREGLSVFEAVKQNPHLIIEDVLRCDIEDQEKQQYLW